MPHEGEVLALDIGTRTIMGVVLEKAPNGYRIRAAEQFEHQDRAMYQGQVHDVLAVAESVKKLKTVLERRRKNLRTSCCAAAGRSLKCQPVRPGGGEIPGGGNSGRDRTFGAGGAAGGPAQLVSAEGEAAAVGFFCVGYSTSRYLLDGEPISELRGQVCAEIGVELIATFLPRVVVNALLSVLKHAELEPASLTLEPIAALEASVPAGMRQLNLALLDIGAGTTDIALVRRGRVFAYGMAPLAGDKITDAICQKYLLDFAVAEAVKKKLAQQDEVTFTDILGNKQRLASERIIASLSELIEQMAADIAAQVLSLNGGRPDAVLLVGGGSLTPGFPQALADAMELPQSRVGIRTREMITTVTGQSKKLGGPQGVTPLGIAMTAFGSGPLHFVDVTVNGQPVPLWQGAGQTVADALLAASGSWTHLFGRPGLALTVEINGRLKVIPGEQGQSPHILVNGQPAALDTVLSPGAKIEFTPGKHGRPAQALVRDLIAEGRTITINGKSYPFPAAVYLNGHPADLDAKVPDRACVTIDWEQPLAEILMATGVDPAQLKKEDIPYRLGAKQHVFSFCPCQVSVNGRAASLTELVRPGDTIEYVLNRPRPTVGSVLAAHMVPKPPLVIAENGQELKLPASGTEILVRGRPARAEDPLEPGRKSPDSRTVRLYCQRFVRIDRCEKTSCARW